MPDLVNIATYPAIKNRAEGRLPNVDKPGSTKPAKAGKSVKPAKGVRVRVMKVEKQVRRRRKDPRAREFY